MGAPSVNLPDGRHALIARVGSLGSPFHSVLSAPSFPRTRESRVYATLHIPDAQVANLRYCRVNPYVPSLLTGNRRRTRPVLLTPAGAYPHSMLSHDFRLGHPWGMYCHEGLKLCSDYGGAQHAVPLPRLSNHINTPLCLPCCSRRQHLGQAPRTLVRRYRPRGADRAARGRRTLTEFRP